MMQYWEDYITWHDLDFIRDASSCPGDWLELTVLRILKHAVTPAAWNKYQC